MLRHGILAMGMCVLLGVGGGVWAADANQPKDKAIVTKGMVVDVNDASGKPAGVVLRVDKNLSYRISTDGKGNELINTMKGKKVRVTGTVATKDRVKWLTVTEFSEAKSEMRAVPRQRQPQEPNDRPTKPRPKPKSRPAGEPNKPR